MDKFASFNVLPDEEYETAKILHQTGESLGCIIVFKTRPNGYRVTYSKKSNRKALFWMEISDNSLLVKANLLHISDYTEKTSSCSDTIKKSITATKECVNCHPLCGSLHVSYHIDGIKYTPCYFKGHYFSRMSKADWDMLNDLIVLENDAV